jgi:solute carrier family 39 (zinc transporter), member 1/2/3
LDNLLHSKKKRKRIEMSLFWTKFGMLVGILVMSVCMALVPFALKNTSPRVKTKLLSFGNAFAGGVFLGIGMVHLLFESNELMQITMHMEYGLAFIMCVGGFLIVFFIEKGKWVNCMCFHNMS